jgi:putative ABC transport system permease protein
VVMTGLLLRSLWKVEQIQPGFDPRNLTTAYFTLPKNDADFEERVLTRLKSAPGVESAALVYPVPFTTGGLTSGFGIRNRQRQPGEPEWHGEAYFVTQEYLATMRIGLLRGRGITAADSEKAPMICLIDRRLAERFFPNEDPIGQQISMYGDWAQIVGIAETIRADGLEAVDRPVVYYSLPQVPFFRQAAAVVRSKLPAGRVIREAVRSANATAPVFDVQTMEERIGESLGIRRVLAALLAIFGGISLLLAAIGIYGVIAQVVAERTQEVGIRIAIGARPGQILAQFLRQGLRAGAIGLVLGAALTVAVQRWVGALLYRTPALDATVLIAAAIGLGVVMTAAVWWPALRASRVNPQTALRHE